jgi:hypothetical protein
MPKGEQTLLQVWVPTGLLEAARMLAAGEGVSFSRWLREQLEELVRVLA